MRAEIKECGDVTLSEGQRRRVKSFLDESDGLRLFLMAKMQTKAGCNLTTPEIVERFATYCSEHGWGMSSTIAERQLPDLMFELFNVGKSNNLEREGKTHRGFRGLTFRPDDDYDP